MTKSEERWATIGVQPRTLLVTSGSETMATFEGPPETTIKMMKLTFQRIRINKIPPSNPATKAKLFAIRRDALACSRILNTDPPERIESRSKSPLHLPLTRHPELGAIRKVPIPQRVSKIPTSDGKVPHRRAQHLCTTSGRAKSWGGAPVPLEVFIWENAGVVETLPCNDCWHNP